MKALKEFFSGGTVLKCFIFALVVSVLFVARVDHVKHIPFFGRQSLQVYVAFTVTNFIIFMLLFLVLFLLGRREQKD